MPRRYVTVQLRPQPTRALNALVVVNVAVFLLWQWALAQPGGTDGPWALFMQDHFLVSAEALREGRVWTLLTSAFSHNWSAHLFFNLLALWVFGRDIERVVGARAFLHLYVAGGILASLGHVAYLAATGTDVPALGASGSVMAVAVVAANLFPSRLLLLFFFIPMPQWLAVGIFILLDVGGLIAPGEDIIAHAAHLGGALYGWFYVKRHLGGYLRARLEELGHDAPRWAPHGVWTHPPQD